MMEFRAVSQSADEVQAAPSTPSGVARGAELRSARGAES